MDSPRARLRRSSAEAQGASSANRLALAPHRLSGRELDTISCVPFRADYFRAASRSKRIDAYRKGGTAVRSVRHQRSPHRVTIAPKIGVVLAVVTLLGAAIEVDAAAHCRPGAYWRTREAESITTIRGMRVRVDECRGLGRAVVDNGVRRYRHFRCDAATRARGADVRHGDGALRPPPARAVRRAPFPPHTHARRVHRGPRDPVISP